MADPNFGSRLIATEGRVRTVPRPDQAQAIEAVVRQFQGGAARAQLIAAPGVGKTLMAWWILEELDPVLSVVFAPSLALLSQTARVWLGEGAVGTRWQALCVCSDDSITDDLPPADVPVPVTTNPAAIADFLTRSGRARKRILFATYQSVAAVAEALAAVKAHVQLLVADEAHRLAGPEGKRFQFVLNQARVPADHRLFLTATPRILPPRLERSPDGVAVVSMSDTSLFGVVASRTSFGEAISLGLLADYRLDVLFVQDPAVASLLTDPDPVLLAVAQAGALVGAMEEERFKRVFTLHHTLSSARRYVAAFKMALRERRLESWTAGLVAGTDTVAERLGTLTQLCESPAGVIASVRTLIEGIDVPALDAVCFVDPKQSVVEIAQGIGRALRRDPARPGKMAHIIVPVLVRDPARAHEELLGSAWAPVWRVLAAMAANDERLAEVLALAQRYKAADDAQSPRSSASPVAPELVSALERMIHLALPATIPLARLRSGIAVRALAELGDSFEYGLGRLQVYAERTGSGRVRVAHVEPDGYRLGNWAAAQRAAYRRGRIGPDEVQKLEAVPGWTWTRDEGVWSEGLRQLQSFIRTHGHARVPTIHWTHRGFWLGEWVNDVRMEYWRDSLAALRAAQLEAMPGWSWGSRASARPLPLGLPSSVQSPGTLLDKRYLAHVRGCSTLEQLSPPARLLLHLAAEYHGPWQRAPVHPLCDWLVRTYLPVLLRRGNLVEPARRLEEQDEILVRSDLNHVDWQLERSEEWVENRIARLRLHAPHVAWSLNPELATTDSFHAAVDARLWDERWTMLFEENPTARIMARVRRCTRQLAHLLALPSFINSIPRDHRWATVQRLVARTRHTPALRYESQYTIAERLLERHFHTPDLRERRLGTRDRSEAYYILTGTVEAQEAIAADRGMMRLIRRVGHIPTQDRSYRLAEDEQISRLQGRVKVPAEQGPRDRMRLALVHWRARALEPLYAALDLNREPSYRWWRRDYRGIQWVRSSKIRLEEIEGPEGGRKRERVRILRAPRSLALAAWRARQITGLEEILPRSTLLAAAPAHGLCTGSEVRRYRALWVQDSTPRGERAVVVGWLDVRHGAVCGVQASECEANLSDPRFGPAPRKKAAGEQPNRAERSHLKPPPGTVIRQLNAAWWPDAAPPWKIGSGEVEPLGLPVWSETSTEILPRQAMTSTRAARRDASAREPSSSTPDAWYILAEGGLSHGPIDAKELRRRLRYAPDLLIRHVSSNDWNPAAECVLLQQVRPARR